MNKAMIAGIAVVVIVALLGAGYFVFSKNQNNGLVQDDQTTQQVSSDTGMQDEEMMESSDEAMIEESEGESMMEDETSMMDENRKIVIEGSNYKYFPSSFTVKAGEKVRIVFKNVGGMHDLNIEELEIGTSIINTGEEEVLEFTAPDTPGTLTYYCSVANHRALGMEGTITVE